ncbi:hypothetical protein [Pedobacter agri]|uniref:hypothetical protein n=1 Tax=Pedobacter agri TaxID=454586 RepID=UPI00277F151E|nr:hypothetical protein [Pedobacter agri]MDQ1139442.1 hypothetical protein [Pedobacter agri]
MKTDPNAPINVVDGMYASDAMSSDKTGLTKREHFAALAMQGLLADGTSESHLSDLAKRAVAAADYLILALNK